MKIDWFRSRWEKTTALAATLVGIGLLVAGWVGVSGSSLTTEQIPYLVSGAVGGLFALGVAATLWLSADLRDQYFKLDEIHSWMRGDEEPSAGDQPSAARDQSGPNGDVLLVPVVRPVPTTSASSRS